MSARACAQQWQLLCQPFAWLLLLLVAAHSLLFCQLFG
jgi:hypothetical protein